MPGTVVTVTKAGESPAFCSWRCQFKDNLVMQRQSGPSLDSVLHTPWRLDTRAGKAGLIVMHEQGL